MTRGPLFDDNAATMIDLYYATTGNSRRVAIVLEECGLTHHRHKVELGPNKPAEVLALNPIGALPIIVDSEGPGSQRVVLTQSAAICLYLAEKSGRFLPAAPAARAHTVEALALVTTDIGPASSAIYYVGRDLPANTEAVAYFENRLGTYLGHADRQLASGPYLCGSELTVADFALYPVYWGRKALAEKFGLKNLARWGAAMADRPGVQRGMQLA